MDHQKNNYKTPVPTSDHRPSDPNEKTFSIYLLPTQVTGVLLNIVISWRQRVKGNGLKVVLRLEAIAPHFYRKGQQILVPVTYKNIYDDILL